MTSHGPSLDETGAGEPSRSGRVVSKQSALAVATPLVVKTVQTSSGSGDVGSSPADPDPASLPAEGGGGGDDGSECTPANDVHGEVVKSGEAGESGEVGESESSGLAGSVNEGQEDPREPQGVDVGMAPENEAAGASAQDDGVDSVGGVEAGSEPVAVSQAGDLGEWRRSQGPASQNPGQNASIAQGQPPVCATCEPSAEVRLGRLRSTPEQNRRNCA